MNFAGSEVPGFRGSEVLLLAFVLAAMGISASCARGLFVPPAGPGEPAPEASAAWAQATAACRDVRTYSATLRLSGRIGEQGIPRVSAILAVTAAGDIRLQIVAGGRPRLTLAGTADRATFLLHDDNRVVAARADEIVERIAGVKLGPERWLAILTGCVTRRPEVVRAERFGNLLRIDTSDGRIYLRQRAGQWQTVAGEVDDLVVQYWRTDSAFPTHLQLDSAPGRSPVTTLRVRDVDQLEVNETIRPEVFAPPPEAAAATPMTLDELRATGPLRGKNSDKFE